MSRGRAFRRWQYQKHKKRAIRKLLLMRSDYEGVDEELDPRHIGVWTATKHPCSCALCGSRRRIEGPTIQERRDPLYGEKLRSFRGYGAEYWSRRGAPGGMKPGRISKQLTTRSERAEERRLQERYERDGRLQDV